MTLHGGSPKGRDAPSAAASGEAGLSLELLSWQNSAARAEERALATLSLPVYVCLPVTVMWV